MTRAYILIKTAIGTTEQTQATLRELAGVRAVDIVTGDFDLIVQAELPGAPEIGRLVMRDIHGVDGIKDTATCIVVG